MDYKGLDKVYTFNPFNETWTEQPDMRDGRWYPTGVRLADGRIVVVSGLDKSGAGFSRNPDVELFTPSADMNGRGTVSLLGTLGGAGQPPIGGLYPHMFAMPSGRTAGGGTVPRRQLVVQPARRGEQLHLAGLPGQLSRPALGHRSAGARRDRWVDARDAAGRLGAAHDHRRPPPTSRCRRPRSSMTQTPRQAGRRTPR